MRTETFYYVHVHQTDTRATRWDFRGDKYEFTEVTWSGPYEYKQQALDYIETSGYSRMAYSPKVIELELPVYDKNSG